MFRARSHRSRRVVFAVYLLVLGASSVGGPVRAAGDELAAPLQPLAYRVGTWTAAVEWLDAAGTVTRVVPSIRDVRVVFGGHGLQERGRLVGTATEVVAVIYVDQETKRITEVGVMPGVRDVLHATIEEDRITFTAEPRQRRDQTVIFRAIDSNFAPDRYDTTGWVSTDGGKTWRQTFRQTNHRVRGVWGG